MAYKLIALDLDGTLLNRQGEIAEANVSAIRAASKAGVKVILATGRPIRQVRPHAEKLELNLPLVVNNGSEVWLTPSTLLFRHELEPEWIGRILRLIDEYGEEMDYWAHTVEGEIKRGNRPEDLRGLRWLQFAVRTGNNALLQKVRDELLSWNRFEISNSHATNIECNPIGISKASGLQAVCGELGAALSETIAVGDSLNDIPMIRAAGFGVAMGNAQQPVKEAADAIAPGNTEDGVAYIIHRYLLSDSVQ